MINSVLLFIIFILMKDLNCTSKNL